MSDNRTADWLDDRDQAHDFLKEYMGEDVYDKARAKRSMQTTVVEVGYLMRKFASQQTASLREENERLQQRLSEVIRESSNRSIIIAKHEQLQEEVERLRTALDEIAYPVKYMQMRAKESGGELNGIMAVQLSESPSHLKGIALKALSGKESKQD